jgi:hypothetical protein
MPRRGHLGHRARRFDRPRARAYLLTDQTVESAATHYADLRPPLDAVSQQAIEDQDPYPERTVVPPDPDATATDGEGDGPETPGAGRWRM